MKHTRNLALAIALVPVQRLAVSHDGNMHDRDDWGAATMVEALLWRAGPQQAQLVHLEYNSHLGQSTASWEAAMRTSARRPALLYGIDRAVVRDVQDGSPTHQHLADAIAAGPLTILQGGPWESTARAFDLCPPEFHAGVTIITHSDWNDEHRHLSSHRDRAMFEAQFPGPTVVRIVDQNNHAFRASMSEWAWLNSGPRQTKFVRLRTGASGPAAGDMSDAGMAFYWLTGNPTPTMADVRGYFGL